MATALAAKRQLTSLLAAQRAGGKLPALLVYGLPLDNSITMWLVVDMQATVSQSKNGFSLQYPGLAQELFRVNAELADQPDAFYRSLEESLRRYGSVTERQAAALKRSLAARLNRLEERAARPAPQPMPPTGQRVGITGTVLSTKYVENAFGGALKMLVETTTGWRVYGTAPSHLVCNGIGKGDVVTFVAALEPKEADFGFFSRPAQARFVRRAAEVAEVAPVQEPPRARVSDPMPVDRDGEDETGQVGWTMPVADRSIGARLATVKERIADAKQAVARPFLASLIK
jgi:hypothetical protein